MSNQYKFYKKKYKKFKKENKKFKKKNLKLQLENIDLKKELGLNSKKEILGNFKNGNYENLKVSIKSPNPKGHHHWGDYFYALALKKALEKHGFNVNIHEKNEWYGHDREDIVIVLRGLSKYKVDYNSINIMWNISHPDKVNLEEYESYDIVFVASEKYAREIKKDLNTTVESLLQCCDPDIFYPKENDNLKNNEILFIGSTRSVFRDVVKNISKTNHNYAIYGLGWEDFIDEKYIKDDFIPNEMLNQYYSSCKILLNDHWDDMKEWGFVSNRIFDALACGAFIISDKMQEVDNLFEGNVITYDDLEDLNEKIEYYLNHDDERRKKVNKGREIVLDNHTFDSRVSKIIDVLNDFKL